MRLSAVQVPPEVSQQSPNGEGISDTEEKDEKEEEEEDPRGTDKVQKSQARMDSCR